MHNVSTSYIKAAYAPLIKAKLKRKKAFEKGYKDIMTQEHIGYFDLQALTDCLMVERPNTINNW